MQDTTEAPKLRRELSIWEAIGISLALMAPSMAANINPQGPATLVGRAVPLTFIMATVGVLLVAYTFVRLTQRFNHSGSVYGFVGATLNPRLGILAGWALTGTYVFYGVVTAMAFGRFASTFLDSLGIWKSPTDSAAYILGLIALVGVWALAISPARNGTRILLIIEGLTVALILIVTLVVLFKLANGTAPNGLKIDTSVFSLPDGVDTSTLFLGVVFGFLSFAGFEAAATLGEEAKNPRRDIPKAILGVAIFGGIYFTVVTAVEVMGFGTSDAGVKNFIASGSLLGDLGSQYVASWVGQLITAGGSPQARNAHQRDDRSRCCNGAAGDLRVADPEVGFTYYVPSSRRDWNVDSSRRLLPCHVGCDQASVHEWAKDCRRMGSCHSRPCAHRSCVHAFP